MRHRLANKSLSRPTAHRVMMLRNLVSSLLQHESITTTLTKAKEAQKLADKVIGWGKKGGEANWARANSYLLNPNETLRPLFSTFAQRYASRPGGYTRIVRSGFRVGDRAPLAVLQMVDSHNDLKFENTAATVGREMAIRARQGAGPEGWRNFRKRVEAQGEAGIVEALQESVELESLTRKNVQKSLSNRKPIEVGIEADAPGNSNSDQEISPEADSAEAQNSPIHPATRFLDRAYHHYLHTLATLSLSTTPTPDPTRTVKQLTQRLSPSERRGAPKPVQTVPLAGRVPKAGERTDGWAADEIESGLAQIQTRGGPIGRAKGPRGREARRTVFAPEVETEETLAGERT